MVDATASNTKIPKDPNFGTLNGDDSYAQYFKVLVRMFELLTRFYEHFGAAKTHEATAALEFLNRLLFTTEALRMKYTYSPATKRPLWVDLTNSGFPNSMEIQNLLQDLLARDDRLQALPPHTILKRRVVDRMLGEQQEARDLLWQLSERTYLEMIDDDKLLLPFTPGELIQVGDSRNHRSYSFTWACYDFASNRPYVHVLMFDQDMEQEPLEMEGANWYEFLEIIKGEGSRAPSIGVLALALDDAIETIHPKILRRLCIGPLYSRLLADNCEVEASDPQQAYFNRLLTAFVDDPTSGILLATEETVFSKRQQVSRSIFSPRGRIREVFAITETDPDCYKRQASVVEPNIFLPHRVFQETQREEIEAVIPGFHRFRKITFDRTGGINVHGD